ncbi:MAG: substrate-binding domain-containing protein [Victivallales bacterium]|nr:substrate-binding domain-containing protein [Victivallales bacterium]
MHIERYNFQPIYFQLAERLKRDIAAGILSGQMPTEDELCKQHEVSRNTIRTTLKKLDSEGLIYRVKGKGTFVSPVQIKQKIILLLMSLPLEGHRNLHSLQAGVSMRCHSEKIQVRIISDNHLTESIEEIKNNPKIQAGVLFLRHENISQEMIEQLEKSGIPYLLEGRNVISNANYVDIDNKDAMRKIIDHLYGCGHRRYAMVSTNEQGTTHYREREEATTVHLRSYGIKLDDNCLGRVDIYEDNGKEQVAEIMTEFFSNPSPPTAIVCASDTVAAWVQSWLKKHNIRIPEDVSVTGFDDMEFCKYLDPPLTTIRQDYFQMGRIAADSLLEIMNNYINRKLQIKVKLNLVERESTGSVKSNA